MDERGATAENEVVVTRDSTPPGITEVLPANGFLSASELVKITGKIIDQSPFYVYVGGNAAVLNGELFSTQLTFTEGWTEVEIEAQDLAGNSSSYMLNLLVDTTPPEPFTVTADPDDWTNNPQPIITFGTTDTISGIDYYELAINNGAFIRVESPYQLAPSRMENIPSRSRRWIRPGGRRLPVQKFILTPHRRLFPRVLKSFPGLNVLSCSGIILQKK